MSNVQWWLLTFINELMNIKKTREKRLQDIKFWHSPVNVDIDQVGLMNIQNLNPIDKFRIQVATKLKNHNFLDKFTDREEDNFILK